jgi:phosphoribosyl 1,2-cyclic phosphodiesterase
VRLGFKIWGARGSLPRLTPGQERHGGNTACLEILHPGDQHVIIDAGTGISSLGDVIDIDDARTKRIHLFISHYHWDHIMGLPFFGPIYKKGTTIDLYGLRSDQGHIREMLEMVFSPYYSPIYSPDNLLGQLSIPAERASYEIDDLRISTYPLRDIHPGGYLVIRVALAGRSFVYASDVELRDDAVKESFIQCCEGADLILCNAAFSQQRFEEAIGWGHSSLEVAYEVAHRAGVKRIMGFHYDPLRLDWELEEILRREQGRFTNTCLELAREGEEVWL